MDKAQTIHSFWSSFGWPAYDELSVPEHEDNEAELPYITYMVILDEFEHPVYPSASLWTYGTSWSEIEQKAMEISEFIGLGGKLYNIDSGKLWIQRGHPFSQRISDDNSMVRRIVLNVDMEFMSTI